MKHLILVLILYLTILNPSAAAPKDIWEFKQDITPSNLWNGKSSNLISTNTFNWPDGGKAIVMFFNVDGQLWRCFDYFDIAMRYQSSACFRLKEED